MTSKHSPTGSSGPRRMAGWKPLNNDSTSDRNGTPGNQGCPQEDAKGSASLASSDEPAANADSTTDTKLERKHPEEVNPPVSETDTGSPRNRTEGAVADLETGTSPGIQTVKRRRLGPDAAELSKRKEDLPQPARVGEEKRASGAGRTRMGAGSAAGKIEADSGQQSGSQTRRPTRTGSATRMRGTGARMADGVQPAVRSVGAFPSVVPPPKVPAETAQTASAPPRRVHPVAVTVAILVGAAVMVLTASWMRTLGPIQEFLNTYSGHTDPADTAPSGIPGWVGWQHFFNVFLLVLIVRSGLQVRGERKPPGYWTPKKNSFFSPKGNAPKRVSLSQWLHQSLDVLWVLNGLIFIILLFATGHWMRIVPMSWEIFPHMASAGIQYISLDWPAGHGWVHYNALQVMAYFTTVFIAAPLAILSGLRISTWWPGNADRLNRIYPVELARAVHFPIMLYFVAFTVVHVFLVFFTGVLRNLNQMYTARDVADWWGLIIFLVSLLVIVAGWFLIKPMFTTPIASRMGKVSK